MNDGGDKYFIDTNVLLYAYDISSEQKRRHARNWMDWLWGNTSAHVSWQVLQEFYYNAVFKLGVSTWEARAAVKAWSEWQLPDVTLGLLERAWYWSDHAKISFWDSMIVAAAERSRCHWLLSEDFQAGRRFGDLTVVNPFEHEPGSLAQRV
jgi:predicted nucleic acid-binding protein